MRTFASGRKAAAWSAESIPWFQEDQIRLLLRSMPPTPDPLS